MAVFPEKVVFKNTTAGSTYSLGAVKPGAPSSLVPGEFLVYREAGGFRLYSLNLSGTVTQVSAKIVNENKGSVTVTNDGEGPSSFTLTPSSITASQVADSSVTSAKISGVIPISKGGTGQTTAPAAINALLPSQTGNAGKVLSTTGSSLTWVNKIDSINDFDEVDTVTVPAVSSDRLTWNSSTLKWESTSDISPLAVPATSSSAGRLGQVTYDSNYLYSCVATNQWKRAALFSWNYSTVLMDYISTVAATPPPDRAGALFPEYVGSGTYTPSRTPSVPWPAGHKLGDIGLLIMAGDASTPSGGNIAEWTLVTTAVQVGSPSPPAGTGLRLYYKIALSSSEANATWSTGNFDYGSQIIVFRNVSASNPIDVSTGSYVANGVSESQPLSVTTTSYNDAVLFFQRMGGTCGVTGGCQVASSTTLEPALYYDYEAGNNLASPDSSGLVQMHAGRKLDIGLASSVLTYASSAYQNNAAVYRITTALRKRSNTTSQVQVVAPDVSAAPAIPRAGYVDPYWSDVSLLMSMDGANGSTTFTDKSVNNYAFISYGPVISTAQSKFGGSSGSFSGNNLALPDNVNGTGPSPLTNWWTSSFTLEGWIRLNAYPGNSISSPFYGNGNSSNVYWGFGPVTNGTLMFAWTVSGGTFMGNRVPSSSGIIALNTWHHIAMTYDASTGTIRTFSDGILRASLTGGTFGSPVVSGPALIGRTSATLNGYIDELRVTRNVARYTSNFTPPTSAFPSR